MHNDGEMDRAHALPETVNIFAALFLEPAGSRSTPPGRYDRELQQYVDISTGLPLLAADPTHKLTNYMTSVPGCFNDTTSNCPGCTDKDSTCSNDKLDWTSEED